VQVEHDPPRRNFASSRRDRWSSSVTEVNHGATAVRKRDGYWMQIKNANATPRIEYRLDIEPKYD